MEVWTVIPSENHFGKLLFRYMEFILYADNFVKYSPPLHYQLHGLNRILENVTIYVFGESSSVSKIFGIDKSTEKISSLGLWRRFQKWTISIYICVISNNQAGSLTNMKRQIALFIRRLPTPTCRPVFFLECKNSGENHNKFRDIQSAVAENGAITDYSVICQCKDLKKEVACKTEEEFFRFLPILDDKIASFERQITEEIKRKKLHEEDIEKRVVSILDHVSAHDIYTMSKTVTSICKQVGDFSILMLIQTRKVNMVHMIFNIIQENLDDIDGSVLQRVMKYTTEKYFEEDVQEEIISISFSFVIELITDISTRCDVLTLFVPILSIAYTFYLFSYEQSRLMRRTLQQFRLKASDVARCIDRASREISGEQTEFKFELEKFRKDIQKLRDCHEMGNNPFEENNIEEMQSRKTLMYNCNLCPVRHYITLSTDAKGTFLRFKDKPRTRLDIYQMLHQRALSPWSLPLLLIKSLLKLVIGAEDTYSVE